MFSPPGARLPLWLSTAHYLSRLHPWHRRLRAFLAEAALLSASAKNRFGLRVDRLQPPLAPVLRDFPRKLRVHYGFHSLRPQTIFDGYTLAITDTSGCAYGVDPLPFRCQPETSACYSEPSTTCCRAPSSITHLRHTDSRTPPTQRGRSRQHSKPPAVFIIRLRRLFIERAGRVGPLSAYATM